MKKLYVFFDSLLHKELFRIDCPRFAECLVKQFSGLFCISLFI